MTRPTPIERFLSNFAKSDGCWEWTGGLDSRGYGHLRVGGGKRPKAHVFSYQFHVGQVPPGKFVCHRCDNPKCVNPEHLFVGTNAENTADKVSKGRQARGDAIARKLNSDAVREIRAMSGTLRDVASRFGVSRRMIYLIRKGVSWAHLART